MTTRRWFHSFFLPAPFKAAEDYSIFTYGFQSYPESNPNQLLLYQQSHVQSIELSQHAFNRSLITLAFRVSFHSCYAPAKTNRAGNLLVRAEKHPRPEWEEEGLRPPSRDANDDKVPPQGRFRIDRRHPVPYPCSCFIVAPSLPSPHCCPRCALERTTTRSPT